MQGLERDILTDLLAAYGQTANQRILMGRSDSLDAVAADYSFLVAHRDLYRFLHLFADKHRAKVSWLRISADMEGGVSFRKLRVRPINAEVQLCSPN